MEQYTGKSIFKKMAIGKIFYYEKNQTAVKREKVEDVEAEVKRFDSARETAKEQLQRLFEKAQREVGETEAAIFEVHMMMMDDGDYLDSVYNIIRTQETCAEYATAVTGDNFAAMFAAMDDEYMKARAADVKDISERIVNVLSGNGQDVTEMEEPVILVADDLAPSETVQMDKSKLLGFVTRYGSANSHTAILARTMNIPALIEVDIQKDWNGKMAVIDGYEGTVTIDPDEEYLNKAKAIQQEELKKQELLKEMKGKETVTKGGKKIHLYANIGSVSDTAAALMNDAEGIGLFRSEFLYLESEDFPTENEQFLAYKTVAENMAGKKVIIRTLDIGADKQVGYFNLEKEENPALGYRAIRICLTREEIFKTQLRAILRASAFGNISVMFPMIISVEEVKRAKAILEEVKAELKMHGMAYKDIEIGVMIETPASVMISEELAEEVDFFSIGTNDLTQYTLAIDRQNPKLDTFYDPHHPAVLRMIQKTIENGHKGGAWVGICGELGADMELTETFLKMGVDELSVSPTFVLPVRDKVRSLEI
ncbi:MULTISPECIES: phosphoenolpyruvate--protein phosphotransferase [Lachnospiraceae]|jgi:phosphotransferase system enzyme I (PtsI)|uniref:Phosphoenolpyruvate-protein phosphotransferase n=1 Tax=Faecalicatena acetigenes TaxID=2981790 RepID=A0ABT2TEQ0_9FIRM|nr:MULTISPECIES: phosphoenolpyruvate--protein phosphotransferase [Lachnospiraceae]MCU6748758.1 phosphoenolpyruvate--protein phosphotransferase [Faecalicatena acetigenes]RGT71026.1 phosphoenolpyruvate--protein phosphotransferase [Ruminococcus sp. AF18-22]SCI63464.1 Phosphoenolpyruvate-protein phosphotransferase [uncultured Clostridium sp.]